MEELSRHNCCQVNACRRRFGVPYPFVSAIVEVDKAQGWFPWRAEDVTGRQRVAVELRVCVVGG